MIGEYGKFVWLTYLGMALSIVGIYWLLQANLNWAMIALIGAAICDLFDGPFARSLNRTIEEEAYGIEIDSLADMVNFVFFPVVLILTQISQPILALLLAIIYSIASISRLAYFNRAERMAKERLTHFTGLPLAYSALILPLSYLFIEQTSWMTYPTFLMGAMPILSALYVAKIQIPKPNKVAYIIYVILAMVTVIGLVV